VGRGERPTSFIENNCQLLDRFPIVCYSVEQPTIIYPVEDLNRAKALFSKLLGVKPYVDESYYVGFKVGYQDIGLYPNDIGLIQSP